MASSSTSSSLKQDDIIILAYYIFLTSRFDFLLIFIFGDFLFNFHIKNLNKTLVIYSATTFLFVCF